MQFKKSIPYLFWKRKIIWCKNANVIRIQKVVSPDIFGAQFTYFLPKQVLLRSTYKIGFLLIILSVIRHSKFKKKYIWIVKEWCHILWQNFRWQKIFICKNEKKKYVWIFFAFGFKREFKCQKFFHKNVKRNQILQMGIFDHFKFCQNKRNGLNLISSLLRLFS